MCESHYILSEGRVFSLIIVFPRYGKNSNVCIDVVNKVDISNVCYSLIVTVLYLVRLRETSQPVYLSFP